MTFKSKIGKKILEKSKSHQYYVQQYNIQIQNNEQQQKTIYDLKKEYQLKNNEKQEQIQKLKQQNTKLKQKITQQNTENTNTIKQIQKYKQENNKKQEQIQKLKQQNTKLKQKITQQNTENTNTIKRIQKHKEAINKKNKQIQKLKDQNKKLNEKLTSMKNTWGNYKKVQKKILTKIKENEDNVHFIEKNINHFSIQLDSKFNENERNLIYNLDNLNTKIGSYLISIIIPVYNVEKYLEKCFLSLLRQTIGFNNLEVIFVDDCSTDGSFEILREYALNYSNVRLFQTDENSRAGGKPRNIGLKYATSEYVMFLDSDDEYYEDACEVLYNKIVETNSDLVSGLHSRLDVGNSKAEVPLGLCLNTFTDSALKRDERIANLKRLYEKFPDGVVITDIEELPYIVNNINIASKIFDLQFLRNNNIVFPEYIVGQDSVFLYKSLVSAKKLVFIKKAIYLYNFSRNKEGDKSIMYSDDLNLQITRLDAYRMIYEFSQKKELEDITVKLLIKDRMSFFFNRFVLDNDLSEDVLFNIFDSSKELCGLLIRDDIKLPGNLKELFFRICNGQYDEALKLC